ncbi:MAG: metallopeptidase TldD-related protein [Faecousia sp.]
MMKLESMLRANAQVTDYKINVHEIKSYEMFFVRGKLETVRRTDTCDTQVTVYVSHGDFLGSADFLIYPSTTEDQLAELIAKAVGKALLINNKPYVLPSNETGEYAVESNFADFRPEDLAAAVANTVFSANKLQNGSLNSVEVFLNRHHETVINSQGIHKSQVRYDAMVEAIPTYNGVEQSVELYEQYNFGALDEAALYQEIALMMEAVKARYEAVKPRQEISCKVILNKHELSELFYTITDNLRYSAVFSHSTVFQKGDAIQKNPTGDRINITMAGAVEGNIRSTKFDSDGMSLSEMKIVSDGKAVAYFGDNRYGQYLGEKPTGNLRCLCAGTGSLTEAALTEGPYLEVISMSGLQVDFFSDYIGGEVRLAYYHDGEKLTPVTGISISGSAGEVLNSIRFSSKLAVCNGYMGPEKAQLTNMKIF